MNHSDVVARQWKIYEQPQVHIVNRKHATRRVPHINRIYLSYFFFHPCNFLVAFGHAASRIEKEKRTNETWHVSGGDEI